MYTSGSSDNQSVIAKQLFESITDELAIFLFSVIDAVRKVQSKSTEWHITALPLLILIMSGELDVAGRIPNQITIDTRHLPYHDYRMYRAVEEN